jgi:hypothetical protein
MPLQKTGKELSSQLSSTTLARYFWWCYETDQNGSFIISHDVRKGASRRNKNMVFLCYCALWSTAHCRPKVIVFAVTILLFT